MSNYFWAYSPGKTDFGSGADWLLVPPGTIASSPPGPGDAASFSEELPVTLTGTGDVLQLSVASGIITLSGATLTVGTLILSGATVLTGALTIASGSLSVQNSSNLGIDTTTTMNGGGLPSPQTWISRTSVRWC
jgi:hypothetical protein